MPFGPDSTSSALYIVGNRCQQMLGVEREGEETEKAGAAQGVLPPWKEPGASSKISDRRSGFQLEADVRAGVIASILQVCCRATSFRWVRNSSCHMLLLMGRREQALAPDLSLALKTEPCQRGLEARHVNHLVYPQNSEPPSGPQHKEHEG